MTKILLWDLEVSKTRFEIENYGRKIYSNYLRSKDIVRPKSILGAAWKYLDEDRTYVVSTKAEDVFNDEGIVRMLHPIINDSDVLIGHNTDAFDIKEFNGRALKYGLPPIDKPPRKCVDTLKIARKYFRIDSNELSYIADFLEVDQKLGAPDWGAIHQGCEDALRYMREYNKADVDVLEQVYKKLRGWDTRHPDVSQDIKDHDDNDVPSCPNCGSINTINYGIHLNKKRTKEKQKKQCKDCGRQFVWGNWVPRIKWPVKEAQCS